eukprot:7798100-Pyramimonas_sp.AAC.2
MALTEGSADSSAELGCFPERPSDEAILEQENAIKQNTASAKPLGDKEPLEALFKEYADGGNVFKEKIQQLSI